jgi:adenylate cyclase class 2
MIEVEVKARARPETIGNILGLGATLIGTENHRDLYFNSPLRDFKESDEALRIRIKEEGARLTYKGPKLDKETKSRLELTVKIDSPEEMEKILRALDFMRSAEVTKRRTKYALDEAVVAFDEVVGLGSFVEVEISGDEDWEMQASKALALLGRLGLGESIRSSYLELLAEKGRQDGQEKEEDIDKSVQISQGTDRYN